jgi:hypothetical protein
MHQVSLAEILNYSIRELQKNEGLTKEEARGLLAKVICRNIHILFCDAEKVIKEESIRENPTAQK